MHKTIKYVMVAFVAIISIASCKKEINGNAKFDPNGNGCKLASLKADLDILGTYALAFTYDASGRISKATTTDGQTSNYVYMANKITATDGDGNVSEIVLENGRAISSGSDGVISGGGVSYSYTRKYS
ncbi:hypothetical protein [Pedobacter borealis]|uniref:hypothetical protein n=1 Tax=Pedobacter borealis TaxID=475254 RepID=UPI000493745A|nr:hypothetical protein [Pedobacter borealis]